MPATATAACVTQNRQRLSDLVSGVTLLFPSIPLPHPPSLSLPPLPLLHFYPPSPPSSHGIPAPCGWAMLSFCCPKRQSSQISLGPPQLYIRCRFPYFSGQRERGDRIPPQRDRAESAPTKGADACGERGVLGRPRGLILSSEWQKNCRPRRPSFPPALAPAAMEMIHRQTKTQPLQRGCGRPSRKRRKDLRPRDM